MTESTYDLPANPAAEVALLGALLRAGELPAEIEAMVLPEDFGDPHRAEVYAAILRLVHKGKPCDHISVISELDVATRRVMNNGLQLIEFTELAPLGAGVHHAEIVARTGKRRRHLTAGLRIIQLAREDAEDIDDLARQAVDSVPRGGKHSARTAWEVLAEIIDPQAAAPGIPLGLTDLDDLINPLLPGAITAIGARSGIGKTTIALDIMRHAAYRLGIPCLFVSIEMTDREVYTKLLSAESKVDHTKLMWGHPLRPDEERRVSEAASRIGNGPLVVADVDSLTLADYRALVRQYRPTLSAIDFLGMCTFGKADRNELAITEFVYGVKRVSSEEECHTMILSQFNRGSAQRADKRPVMDDFKDSAGLEQAAHLALLLHRPDRYDEEDRPGEVDVFIGKQRNGQSGHAIALAAQLHYSRFVSMTDQNPPPPPSYRSEPMVDVTEPLHHQGE